MSDLELMREALQEARLALAEGELPIGCVITRNGSIIARGHNLREQTNDPTAHAEIVAMRRAAEALNSWRLENCTLYVTLEPCPMCAGAISQARVLRLVYGAADEHYGCAGSVYRIPEDPAFNHFCPCNGGILEKECASLLHEFFEDRRT
ncbi:MAG: tRNA adenosine(34) deaminase TadA [Clostridia bacterium]|nr:tRNA adenosine(34) deaminase TadA [Clostridia bacterium]MBP3652211.1 tRNA adenosine(34) deaminase TadA [Clostridia bacterium]